MTDLAELFARDPLHCADKDIEDLVAQYRSMRKQFTLGDMKAGTVKASPKQQEIKELNERLGLKIGL